MRPEPEHLRDIPLFSALTDDERTSVAAHLELRDVSPGQHLTNQGSSGYFFFVIEEGSAEVTRDGKVSSETKRVIVKAGDQVRTSFNNLDTGVTARVQTLSGR